MLGILVLRLQYTLCPIISPLEGKTAFDLSSFETRTAMAAYETTRTAPFGAIATFRLIQFVSNIVDAIADWNDARVTRNALAKLTDRELDDIGLCRGDIDLIGSKDRV